MTIYLAGLAKRNGYNPVVVSRGYKGGAETKGGIVCDGRTILMDARSAGDEPHMMAKTLNNIPVIVGRDRYQSCTVALEAFSADLIILDDAFQHLQLSRDVDIVLMDYLRPTGNGRLLPRGPLREPLGALKRGDVFIFTRSVTSSPSPPEGLEVALTGKPVFFAAHEPYVYRLERGTKSVLKDKLTADVEIDLDIVKGKRIYSFSGIARNGDFRNSLSACGGVESGFLEFPDHHFYSPEEMELIFQNSEKTGAELLVTTEKDFMRIDGKVTWPLDLVVIGIKISFNENSASFEGLINEKLKDISRST
jgi:tetraacyldisaccharide 4'-kinase